MLSQRMASIRPSRLKKLKEEDKEDDDDIITHSEDFLTSDMENPIKRIGNSPSDIKPFKKRAGGGYASRDRSSGTSDSQLTPKNALTKQNTRRRSKFSKR